jgi:hypothetical protein
MISTRHVVGPVPLLTLAALALTAPLAGAQSAPGVDVDVDWWPAQPAQGTIFVFDARPAAGGRVVGGRFAGEPLHFEARAEGTVRTLAGVPIDAAGTLPAELHLARAEGGIDTVTVQVPIRAGEYRLERLTVAPRFGRAPDAALAARMAREAERAREVSRRSHGTPRLWEGEFLRPRDSRITSGFGNGREFNGQVQSRHMGTDFAGAVGAPVHAPARGVVALVDAFHLGGNVVYLDHGAGLVTAYLHLSATDVAEGDAVEPGQVIGRVGATGRVTGPHLHWIVRYGGVTVDPMSLLALNARIAPAEAAAGR